MAIASDFVGVLVIATAVETACGIWPTASIDTTDFEESEQCSVVVAVLVDMVGVAFVGDAIDFVAAMPVDAVVVVVAIFKRRQKF